MIEKNISCIFKFPSSTLGIRYLAKLLLSRDREFCFYKYLEYLGNSKPTHNNVRSWKRVFHRTLECFIDIIDSVNSDYDAVFNSKADCLVRMLEGNYQLEDLKDRRIFNSSHIKGNLRSLFNLNETESGQVLDCLYNPQLTLPEPVLSKIRVRFPNSTENNRLSSIFVNNLKYIYSY